MKTHSPYWDITTYLGQRHHYGGPKRQLFQKSLVSFKDELSRDARYHLLGLPINTNTIFCFNILPKQNITISKYKLAISKSSKYVSSQRYVETILNKIRFTYPQKYPISNPNHHIYLTKENTVHK